MDAGSRVTQEAKAEGWGVGLPASTLTPGPSPEGRGETARYSAYECPACSHALRGNGQVLPGFCGSGFSRDSRHARSDPHRG
jgi:hypothetical protein